MKKNKIKIIGVLPVIMAIFLPAISFAQGTYTVMSTCVLPQHPNLEILLKYVSCLIGSAVIPLLILLASAMFVWGVIQFIAGAEEEEKISKLLT